MPAPSFHSPVAVLAFGGGVLAVSLGIRHAFGIFLQPMTLANGWGREAFGFAIALQNLVWGLAQPFVGMLADRFGASPVVFGGAVLYALGLTLMAHTTSPAELALSAGVLVGLGLSGTTFAIVFGAVSRVMPAEKRSLAFGVCSAVGSFGQFAMLPGSMALITRFGWATALLILAGLTTSIALISRPFAKNDFGMSTGPGVSQALAEAFGHRGFWLLCMGFFVCGFQVVFISTHLPAYLGDRQMSLAVGTTVLALIGLLNIPGTFLAGLWGGRHPKPRLLAWLYLGRALVISLFLLFPVSTTSTYAFAIAMGLLWLGTVPLTNGTIATFFGVRNLSMLSGIAFLFHQVGAFMGGWLGGLAYDKIGSYDAVWAIAIGLSLLAALLNFPIREVSAARLRNAA